MGEHQRAGAEAEQNKHQHRQPARPCCVRRSSVWRFLPIPPVRQGSAAHGRGKKRIGGHESDAAERVSDERRKHDAEAEAEYNAGQPGERLEQAGREAGSRTEDKEDGGDDERSHTGTSSRRR